MPAFASRMLCKVVCLLSLYRMVLQALDDDSDLEMSRLAQRLYESRKPVMTIVRIPSTAKSLYLLD